VSCNAAVQWTELLLLQAARRASSKGDGIGGEGGVEEGEVPTAPWIFTGGTNSGVMELVGRERMT
jgi:hypothetical protein